MQPAPRDIPHWSEYSNTKTWVKSVDATTAAVVLSVSAGRRLNILQCVVTGDTAGLYEVYHAISAAETLSGDARIAYGNYPANGGENAAFPPYFPKRCAKGQDIFVKGAGIVRVRIYGYKTDEG